jgi:hypothetical protein
MLPILGHVDLLSSHLLERDWQINNRVLGRTPEAVDIRHAWDRHIW